MEYWNTEIEEEIEQEMNRLSNVKGMIARSVDGRNKMKEEYEEFETECQKKIDNLRGLNMAQFDRGAKLEYYLSKTKNPDNRIEELKGIKEELEEDIKQVNIQIETSRKNFQARVKSLREEVKRVYEGLRSDKETKFWMETAMETVKDKDNMAAVLEAMRRLENSSNQERLEVESELKEIEIEKESLEKEITMKEARLRELKEKNLELVGKFHDLSSYIKPPAT